MKKIIVLLLVFGLAFTACSSGGDPSTDDGSLSGTIQIYMYDSPAAESEYDIYTGTDLTAHYSGGEAVAYQWKLNGVDVSADKGGNLKIFTPGEAGSYTVTVSAPGKDSKTSAPVAIVGETIQELSGEVTICIDDVPVTTAQTGDTLTVSYDGDEMVFFQWFRDGEPVTTDPSVDNTYAPPKAGTYTVKVSSGGYTPRMGGPVVVSGQNYVIITFDLNGLIGPPAPDPIAVAPGVAIGTLPEAPERDGFTFMGWYTAPAGGSRITETSALDADGTLFARWRNDTYAIQNPVMEAGLGFDGSIDEEDGTISFTSGAFQYKFPANINLTEYAYFIVRFTLTSPDGNVSGVKLIQYGTADTGYGEITNIYPWFSNNKSTGIQFPISGDGGKGGFAIKWGGQSGQAIVVKITSITLYKLPECTVTFNLDGGDGNAPAPVTLFQGYTLGAKYPAKPTKEDHIFIAWRNQDGTVVTANTPITESWTLTAWWMRPEELGDDWMEAITTTATSAPVYVFDIDTDTLSDYDCIIVKIKSDAAVTGRLRAWGVYDLTTWTNVNTRPNMGNSVGNNETFAATRLLLSDPGLDSFSHAAADGWKEYVLPLNAIARTVQTGATGKLAIAFGVVAPSGGSGQRNYYVKDIVLANTEDQSKKVSALSPVDSSLWGGNGASAYVTGNSSDVVTRTILPYEED